MKNTIISQYTQNQLHILRLIRRNGKVTRAKLSELCGFKLLTVTKTVGQFLADGIVVECGYERSTGGRKAALLSINPDFRYTLAADIGAASVKLGVIGLDGSVVEQEILRQPRRIAKSLQVDELREKFAALIEKYGRDKILGAGIGISGLVRHGEGRVVFCPNIQGWNDMDVHEMLEKPLGIPVLVDTAARCMALAESAFGVGRGVRDQIFVSVGTSVSAGIMMSGKIYRGAGDAAGEIGHTTVKVDSRRCTCGNTGCLELYVTLPMLMRGISAKMAGFKGFSLLKSTDGGELTPEDVRAAALQGDKIAVDALTECANLIGTAMSYMANILNPSLIVLGGGVIECFPEITDDAERFVKRRSFTATQQNLSVKKSTLGPLSAMVGSALQVINDYI